MKKLLFILLLFPLITEAQIYGSILDSTTFAFSATDSLTHYVYGPVTIDTASATLWQIGNTHKPIFSSGTTAARGIMTDTVHPYPANANSFFTVKAGFIPNLIVSIWHKYTTDSLHAGGIVEFSSDTGATWMNIADCPALAKENMYTVTDTLLSGQPAFTGKKTTEQLSRFQFFDCVGEKTTATTCFPNWGVHSSIYLRFRFVSDSTTDSLSGWIIDSIQIGTPDCFPGFVKEFNQQNTFEIFPNPANNALNIHAGYPLHQITITNLLGQVVYKKEHNTKDLLVDIAALPKGLYFIKVNNDEVRKFSKE